MGVRLWLFLEITTDKLGQTDKIGILTLYNNLYNVRFHGDLTARVYISSRSTSNKFTPVECFKICFSLKTMCVYLNCLVMYTYSKPANV